MCVSVAEYHNDEQGVVLHNLPQCEVCILNNTAEHMLNSVSKINTPCMWWYHYFNIYSGIVYYSAII